VIQEPKQYQKPWLLTRHALPLNRVRRRGINFSCEQNITQLDLGWNHITQVGARHLAEMLKSNRVLAVFALEGNRIAAEGGIHVCEALESNSAITHLNLASCNLRKSVASSISTMLRKNSTLEELILKKNGLASSGVQVDSHYFYIMYFILLTELCRH